MRRQVTPSEYVCRLVRVAVRAGPARKHKARSRSRRTGLRPDLQIKPTGGAWRGTAKNVGWLQLRAPSVFRWIVQNKSGVAERRAEGGGCIVVLGLGVGTAPGAT